jgi:hypothetical protein
MIVDGIGVGRVAAGEASCVSGERGIIAEDGFSGDEMELCGSSTGGLSLKTALPDIDRCGASEMVPQPEAIDSSAAVIIHALIRGSTQATWVGELDDLVNEHCMAHRKGYSAMTMPLKYRMDTGRQGGAKARVRAY